jgi:hypothetical protein
MWVTLRRIRGIDNERVEIMSRLVHRLQGDP